MRIACPHCGERGVAEFAYQGDASLTRPASRPGDAGESAAALEWVDYVYTRANAPGEHREYWLHALGCRALLVVTRDASSHEIARVETRR